MRTKAKGNRDLISLPDEQMVKENLSQFRDRLPQMLFNASKFKTNEGLDKSGIISTKFLKDNIRTNEDYDSYGNLLESNDFFFYNFFYNSYN